MSWPMVKLGDVATVITGSTPKKEPGNYGGEIPFVTPGDLGEFAEIVVSSNTLTHQGAKQARELPKGAVLVCCIGATIGKVGIAGRNLVTNQQINSLVFDENKVFPKFAYYYALTMKPAILAGSSSTTMPIINKSNFSKLEMPLPSLAEQKRIAAILDKADAIRRKRQQAIQLADDFLRAVFLEMFGDPVTNPKGWEVKPLSELSSKILNGTTPKGGSEVYVESGVQFLRSQNVWKNHIIYDDVVYLDETTHKSMSKSSLKHKDILMTKTGRINTENSSLGRAALFLGEDDSANINGHVYLIRLKQDINHEFVVFILTSIEYRDYIRSVCVGGIDKRQINKEHLEEFPIIVPPYELQQKFIAQLIRAQKIIEDGNKSLGQSEKIFAALSQKAFSGQL